ncbi:MAG: pilus assembly protein PilM [Tissierellia bacterium]|nr:pilus assembly protein PilM [Tissierellia bacterium]
MRDNLVFSLDIGTRTIIGIVGEYLEEDKLKVLAYSIREHKERNMYDGQIHDIEGVTRLVVDIVKELEEKTGEKLKIVSIAAAGRALKTLRIRIEKKIDSTKEISKLDVEALELEAVQKAQDEINAEENNNFKYYNIGHTVVDYYLDDSRMEKLEGHRGEKIGVDLLATFLPQIVVESLYTVMTKAGLEVGSITLEPIAAINVAIKKELRLLNLALVDIGAGTSDIAITRDGQIISYAMTQTAGDEITERLAKEYLLDFNSSEKLKVRLSKEKYHEFKDIVGVSYRLSTLEIVNSIKDIIEKIATEIADKIIEFNGKAPNAVFLIGGSSQMPMLKETLAERLGLPKERVSIRDLSTIDNIIGLEEINGPDMITPVGIALDGALDRYKNFIKVIFNGEEVRIFNTHDIKVSDVLVITGYNPRDLLPKRAEDFIYYINGKRRVIKGNIGTYPRILVDNKEGNLKTRLQDNSIIEIVPSQVEPISQPWLYDIVQIHKAVTFLGEKVNLIKSVKVNGEVVEENIRLNQEDHIVIEEIRTLEDLLLEYNKELNIDNYLVNGKKPNLNHILNNGDTVTLLEKEDSQEKCIKLVINNEDFEIYYKKDKFIFVDIFDHIDFDLSTLRGKLVLRVNGRDAEYMEELKDGDNIEVYWE